MTYPEKDILKRAAQDYKTKSVLCFTSGIKVQKKGGEGNITFAGDSKNTSITFQHHPDEQGTYSVGNTMIEN